MISAFALGSDNKRYFRGTLPRLAIFTIIMMPLLYCAMYLWAFWNPFGAVEKIPAAIVNMDTGAMNQGKPLQAGDQLVTQLMDSGQLGLTETSDEEAKSGLADGTYYFTITIPTDFSEAVVSPNTKTPHKAKIIFTFNDATNYLSTIIGEDAAEQVLANVNSTIGGTGVNQVLVSIQESGAGIKKAAQGSSELAAGLTKMNKSVGSQLLPGAEKLSNGIDQAYSGSTQLADGTNEMQQKADEALEPLIQRLQSDNLKLVNQTIGEIDQQVLELNAALNNIENSKMFKTIEKAIEKMAASSDPELQELAEALEADYKAFQNDISALRKQYNKIAADFQKIEKALGVSSSGSLTNQLNKLDAAVVSALNTLLGDVNKLNSGAQQLNSGLGELDTGSSTLVSGVKTLKAGTQELVSGADELSSGLEAGLKQIPTWTPEQRQLTADTLSTPVSLDEDVKNVAATFGTGFAPFFSTLALFVGGIIVWMLLTPIQKRPVYSGLGTIRTALASYVPAAFVGILQATVLFLVVKYALGMPVEHSWGMWGFMVLMSWCFLAMIQMFNAIFDIAIGRVVTLALLMVMLISSGGIYPVPTTATPFQVIHPFDPMTYTVMGMRQLSVAVVTDSRLWLSVGVLVGIIVVAIIVTSLCVRRNRRFTMERLYPTIEV